jgi:archaetidylinositol phosphate synthase
MTSKPWDARLARLLITPFIESSVVHPNHFTALRLLVGIAGAACFATGTWLNAGALLVVFSNFLDHTDGELARLSGKSSRFGHYFDLIADAVVTVGMFVGIGIGLARGGLGTQAIIMGAIAGLAVVVIFHLRHLMEDEHGKVATRQPRWAGFEAEDILYLMPLVTVSGGLYWFLHAAAIGIVMLAYLRLSRIPVENSS